MAPFRLLSIDGGAIRGIIPARVLSEIESRTGKPICKLFDVIAGTSTGGILALGLTVGAAGRPKFTAAELVELYKANGPQIFSKPKLWATVDSIVDAIPGARQIEHTLGIPHDEDLHDLFLPKYGAQGREMVLSRYFGEARVNSALTRVFVTSYDTEQRVPVFFDSAADVDDEFFDQLSNVSVVDAAMATSAAPTYFPPHRIETRRVFSLVDGGVFANNPVALAYAFTRPSGARGDIVVSLGTGSLTDSYPYRKIKSWGAIRWAVPVLHLMADGQTEAAALAMRRSVPEQGYFRWQTLLSEEHVSEDGDDATTENIQRIEALAAKLIRDKSAEIDRLCAMLSEPRSSA